MAHKCPVLAPDYKLIKESHGTLASTGCTKDFCEAGRAIHTDELRVGENRAVDVVEQEAEDFLRELHKEKFFASEAAFQERLHRAHVEIRSSSVEGVIRETQITGMVGGIWTQTPQELEFGLRRAWRNARKCIMRSHCEDLRLCDLRSVRSSAQMAVELVKGVTDAYNGGIIIPTVFVFPPRTANNRGPMIWNDQILSFAAYETENGPIMGDPKNVQLTKDIIELGWVPPRPRSRWDVLPIVVMAADDKPVVIELPANLRRLVKIRHPKHEAAFWKLDLKWVAFPAWSRLGFDIGGVQYTAAPFIGWFMDAQIGVRALADSFRYNVLPDIVKALHLDNGALVHGNDFEDLPKYEQLAMLSRAQIELNYAIYHSFLRDSITMSDSLAASKKWTRYDDEFEKNNGYRLPSDPYWIAPPQGSIIPLWHRGGAPNYQPKPSICRHVQDPVKAWKREQPTWTPMIVHLPAHAQSLTIPPGLARDDSIADGKPIPISHRNVAVDTISDVKTNLNYDGPSLGVSLSSIASQDGIASPPESESSTDYFSLSTDVELDSLASSWDDLVELAAMPESSSSINVIKLPLATDLNSLSTHWETPVDLAAEPDSSSLISVDEPRLSTDVSSPSSSLGILVEPTAETESSFLTNMDKLPLSNDEKLNSSTSWGTLELVAQPESSPSTNVDKSLILRHRRSNSLSTIDEDSNEDADEEEEESESEDEGEEIPYINENESRPATRTASTDESDLQIDLSIDGEPNISPPPATIFADHSNIEVEDSSSGDKEEQENEPSPSGVVTTSVYDLATVTRDVNNKPPLLESIAMAEKALAAHGASTLNPSDQSERLQQYELPPVIRIVHPTIYIPTLYAYSGTLRAPNPFTLEDPIKAISRALKRMYSHLIQPYNAGISPERPIHSTANGKPILLAHMEVDGILTFGGEASSSSNSRALGSSSYSSASRGNIGPRETESIPSMGTGNPPLPTDVEWGSWPGGWDVLELAAKLHHKVKIWTDFLHDIILTAHPLDNLKALIADNTFFWSSAQAVREIFQLMAKALHRWARAFVTEDRRRKAASAIRFSATTVVDMLLVYLTHLRARWGDP